MKRSEYYAKDDPELMRLVEFLIDCCIEFEVHYRHDFIPVVEFECGDHLYSRLLKYVYRA